MAAEKRADRFALVDASVVPHDDDVPAQMTQEMAQETANLAVMDVLGVQLVEKTESFALGAERNGGDHRDALVRVVVRNNGRLATRPPALAHGWDQEEARFVGEDKMGAQPRSVFFILGHSLRFHCSMACSSRSMARLTGF